MTSNLTPQQVMETLSQIARDIDETTADIARLDEAAVKARVAHKLAYARAFLSVEGSVAVRNYTADLETAASLLDTELRDQELRAAHSSIKALRDRLEVGRSISPLVRLEWGSQ